jgi:hypothetical protein
MMKLSVLCVVLCVSLPSVAFSRGGSMGSLHSSSGRGLPVTGGAFGTSPSAPGTNSLGTALSSDAAGNGPQRGPLLGSNPAIDRDEAKVDRIIGSICRGC